MDLTTERYITHSSLSHLQLFVGQLDKREIVHSLMLATSYRSMQVNFWTTVLSLSVSTRLSWIKFTLRMDLNFFFSEISKFYTFHWDKDVNLLRARMELPWKLPSKLSAAGKWILNCICQRIYVFEQCCISLRELVMGNVRMKYSIKISMK